MDHVHHTGHCLCGAVSLSITQEPLVARTCWCRLCQYIAAGNASVNGVFRLEAVTITGELRSHTVMPASGNAKQHHFCPQCGTQIAVSPSSLPEFIILRLGVLDSPAFGPQVTIWTSSAPDWACINDSLPRYDEGAPAPKAK